MEDIEIAFKNFEEKATAKLEGWARQTLFDITENIVMDTPVLTGSLISQWRAAFDAPDLTVTDEKDDTKEPREAKGMIAREAARVVIAELKGGKTLYFTNGSAYARRIEYGWEGTSLDGSSAYFVNGRHMVTDNVARAQVIADKWADVFRDK